MTPDQFNKIKNILAEVADLPEDQQQAFIDQACEGDDELKAHLIELLALQDSTLADALEQPAIDDFLQQNTSAEEIPELIEGQQINQYTIIKKIGSGGMGAVYTAEQQLPAKRTVALKLIKNLPNQDFLLREVQILASLNHPNIATLFEINKTNEGLSFIAMEWVDGEHIIEWCEQKNLDKAQRLSLFKQLCDGISHAHEKGIIHCDIKPSNVLITEITGHPVVKVIDFGISQQGNADHNVSYSGTPTYMAPEVFQDKKRLADVRRDVFSLGILLKKLLSKEVVNKGLSAIIAKATAADPKERYAAVTLLAQDLENYQNHLPTSAQHHGLLYTTTLLFKRRLGLVLFSLALLLSVVAGYISQSIQAKKAAQQAQLAKQAQTRAEAVSDFLTNLFNVANPERGRQAATTAAELIGSAKDQLLAKTDPTLEDAHFMHTVGSILTRMGQYDDAEMLLEQSLATKQIFLPENDDQLISSMNQLGVIYGRNLQFGKAEKTLHKSIDLLTSKDPGNQEQLAFAHNHLGNVYSRQRQYESAITVYLKAAELRSLLNDKKHLADSYNNLGATYRQMFDWQKASQYLNKGLVLYEEIYDDDHPFIAATKHNLAYIEEQQHHWDKADQLHRESLNAWIKAYGLTHQTTLIGIKNTTQYHQRRANYQASIPVLLEAIAELKAAKRFEDQANLLSFLGKSYAYLNNHKQAVEVHQQAIDLALMSDTKDPYFPARMYYRFAESLIQLRAYDSAENALLQAKQHTAEVPKGQFLSLYIENLLAEVYLDTEKYQQAVQIYTQILSYSELTSKYSQIEQVKALLGLGKINRISQQFDVAQRYLDNAISLSKQLDRSKHPLTAELHQELGFLHQQNNQLEQAEKAFNHAFQILKTALPKQHPDLLRVQSLLKTVD